MALCARRVACHHRRTVHTDQFSASGSISEDTVPVHSVFDSSIGSASSMARSDQEVLVPSGDIASRNSILGDLEPNFRPVRSAPYIITHIALLAALFVTVLLLPFPFFCEYNRCGLHTYSVQVLLHVAVWIISAVLHWVLHRLHYESYIKGYTEFYNQTRLHRRIPALVYSLGNALLLLLSVVMRELGPAEGPPPPPYPVQWPLSAFHYAQLLVALEVLALAPVLIRYLRSVLQFNTARLPPDVSHEDMDLTPRDISRSRATQDDFGYMTKLLRRQADTIQALRAHNVMLGRKIVDLHSRLPPTPAGSVDQNQQPVST